jgi:hypothetical protein
MQLRLEKSDQKLLLWSGALMLAIIVALALSSHDQDDSGIPSTYSPQSSGAKAAFLLLQREGYNVERWERSPAELPPNAEESVLVLARPTDFPSPDERSALEGYLNRGGRILAIGPSISLFVPRAQTQPEFAADPLWKEYHPQRLSAVTRGGLIQMSPDAYWDHASTLYSTHYADDQGRPLVVSYKVGKGQVIWWASSIPLTNAGISASGNLALLLNSLGDRHTHIYWDEYFHHIRRTLLSYATERPILFGLLQAGLVGLALLMTHSRRNGPIYSPGEPSRLSPLEFVETLGGLYHRAHHTRTALDIPYARFRMLATRQLGVKADVAAVDLARAIRNRLHSQDMALESLLKSIESALYDPDLTERTALKLAQQLSVHAHNLQLMSHQQQETKAHAYSASGTHAWKN